MALHLNLLHEEILEQRQRQRDPLKIGFLLLLFVAALMVVFYMWKGYETLGMKSRLAAVQAEWAKVEPTVTAAQARTKELTGIIATTRVLEGMVEDRFYWAPFLQTLSRCVAPNAQLTSIDGTVAVDTNSVSVTIEGIAAGREPRSAAEELRQLLIDQLGQSYKNVKVEFKTLEDLDTLVMVAGANMAMARYVLGVTFDTTEAAPAATPAPARVPRS
jgi:Tfp pilus assembly protein PilN